MFGLFAASFDSSFADIFMTQLFETWIPVGLLGTASHGSCIELKTEVVILVGQTETSGSA